MFPYVLIFGDLPHEDIAPVLEWAYEPAFEIENIGIDVLRNLLPEGLVGFESETQFYCLLPQLGRIMVRDSELVRSIFGNRCPQSCRGMLISAIELDDQVRSCWQLAKEVVWNSVMVPKAIKFMIWYPEIKVFKLDSASQNL